MSLRTPSSCGARNILLDMRCLLLPPRDLDRLAQTIRHAAPGIECVLPPQRTLTAVREVLPECEIVITDWSAQLRLGPQEAACAPSLRLIQHPAVGYDSVDVDVWSGRGVPVASTPGANARSVAQWTLGAVLDATRRISWGDRRMRAGEWPLAAIASAELAENEQLNVGVVGYGAVGRECVRLFEAVGFATCFWSRASRPGEDRWRDIDELIATSDVLVLALPLTQSTKHFVDAAVLRRMQPGSVLVNIGRGPLVDTAALEEALVLGTIGGAVLDVFDDEPLPRDSPLRSLDTVILSPHAASMTATSRDRIYGMVASNVAAVAEGRDPEWVINAEQIAGPHPQAS